MNVQVIKINDLQCKACGKTFDVTDSRALAGVICPRCGVGNTAPAKIGDLHIVEMLGLGGMGVVYRAIDTALQRHVAVKLLKPQPGGKNSAAIQNAVEEARAQARISHPHVAHIYAIHWLGEQPVISMELVNGGSIDQFITRDPPMDEARALELALQIARGLSAIWKSKIVYGDVKPSNILLDSEGVVKLTDFGLARAVKSADAPTDDDKWTVDPASPGASALGATGIGTAAYIAPEVVHRKPPDNRSDIYSLGITLFQMLTGDTPFQGNTKGEKIAARMKGHVPSVSSVRKNVRPRTNEVVQKMMAFYPEQRHQTYDELISELNLAFYSLQSEVLAEQIAGPADESSAKTGGEPDPFDSMMMKPIVVAPEKPEKKQSAVARLLTQGASSISPAINRILGAGNPRSGGGGGGDAKK